ncbi:hypothetical protein GCM10027405_02830 [Arthrobacter alkaliphilus]
MAAFNETPDVHSYPVPGRPVFVDASGRRLRRLKFLGIGALAVVAGYLSLLLVAVVGGPNIAAPYLPFPVSPAVPEARVVPSAGDPPASPPVPASQGSGPGSGDSAAAGPLARTVLPAPAAPVPGATVAPPVGGATVAGPAAPVATIAPTTVQSSAGKSGAAPGRTVRPSAPAHP